MQRTPVILGVLALLMLGFILFFERGSLSTTEREQRRGHVLETFVRDKITRLEVQRKGVTTVLERKPAESLGLPLGAWEVSAPYHAKAEADAVDSLLGAIEWIDARRTLHDVTADDMAKFGLGKPRYRVSFMIGRARSTFSIGSETPEGGSIYLQADDPKTVYVVGKDATEALDHDAAYFHTKELHEDNFSIYGARKLTVHDAHGEHVVEKRGDYFWLTKPEQCLASEAVMGDLVSGLDGLRAQRFVTAQPKSLVEFGLDAPTFDAHLESQTYGPLPKPGDKAHAQALWLRVGKACAEHDGESYIRVDDGPIMCAANADLDKLKAQMGALRDLRLLALDGSQIHGVRVQAASRELVLTQDGDSWHYKRLDHGKEIAAGAADPAAVADWLKALSTVTADSISGAPPPRVVGDVVGDATVITFDRGKDKPAYRVCFGDGAAGHIGVARTDEPMTLLFATSVLELVDTSTARFRKHALLDEKEDDWRSLSLTRKGGVRETVTKVGAAYRFEAPVSTEPERATVDEIVRVFSKLEAARFVADAPSPVHGLADPAFVLELQYAADGGSQTRHVLRLGSEIDAGRYAQLDADPQVFIAPTALVSQLREPLVSHAALATPLEQIQRVRVEQGHYILEIERSGNAFVPSKGSAGDAARAEALARALATLRASHVPAYGAPSSGEGLDHSAARIVVTRVGNAQPASYTLLIGNAAPGAAANADVPVRRSDLAVAFTVPTRAVDELLSRVPAAAAPASATPH